MGKEKDEYQPSGKLKPNNPWYKRIGHSSQRQAEQNEGSAYSSPATYVPPQTYSPSQTFAPPPGPPPSHKSSLIPDYAPPPGPPPNMSSDQPPPYHDWTVIPDNSLLPPPPSIGYDASPTANASEDEGENAEAWCQANPLWLPGSFTQAQHDFIQSGQLTMLRPPTYRGDVRSRNRPGHWHFQTKPECTDSCLLTSLPLYSAIWDNPLRTHRSKTIYFELRFNTKSTNRRNPQYGLAIGFAAPPFPTFRLPGWHRGSLGVHSDDGHKFVNDTWGGNDFTTPFMPGETLGIGMTFSPPQNPPGYEERGGLEKQLDIRVFFTRNGEIVGGWDGNEELDARSEGGTIGLRGESDLFAAVGVYGGVDFDVFFVGQDWKYRPG